MAREPEELYKADTRIETPQQPLREVKVCASPQVLRGALCDVRAVARVTMGSVGHQEKPACPSRLRGGVTTARLLSFVCL